MYDRRLKLRHCEQTQFENPLILSTVRFSDDKLFGNRFAAFESSIENLIVEETCGNETCKETRFGRVVRKAKKNLKASARESQ
jgi:hypothetical protein